MDLGLTDKVALVTGASSGLGFACAQALLAEGARVCVSGSDRRRIDDAAKSLDESLGPVDERGHGASGTRTLGAVLDLTDPEDPGAVIDHITGHFGTPPTLLVMSTGGPPGGNFESTTDDAWERALDLVLRGAIRTIRAVLPGMRAAGSGRIVLLTSIAGQEPIDGLLTSSTVRAGLHGLVNATAREFGPDGVTINVVMPGYTATARLLELADRWAKERDTTSDAIVEGLANAVPIRRIAEPSELGATVTFLCSNQAAAINGVALPVDGGELRSI